MWKRKLKILVIAAGLLLAACNNSKTPDRNTKQNDQRQALYKCPMHPEVTGREGEKCPKCGMELAAASTTESNQSTVQLITVPEQPEAGTPVEMKFVFTDGGRPIEMEVAHEKKLHLIAVSDELSWFRHIHPQEQKDGSYVISETFPHGGKYLLFTDYKPMGGPQTVHKKEVSVKGSAATEDVFASAKSVSEVDGYQVTLENAADLRTNRTQPLQISIEKDGKKVSANDIQTYLGATAHLVMIGSDKEFLHIHPMENDRYPVYAETHIEKTGAYRIWVEFKTAGKVHTADFTVTVNKGDEAIQKEHHHNGKDH